MADDDTPLGGSESTGGQGDQSTTAEAEPRDPPAQEEEPQQKEEPERPSQKPADTQTELHALSERLNQLVEQAATREKAMKDQIEPELENLRKLAETPTPTPPQAQGPPPPPTAQQKGGVAEFAINLLKFGGLLALAYGAGGRSRGHGAVMKMAIGSALEGYFKGSKEASDASMRLWEKNNEVVKETNRNQLAEYHATLADNRLKLSTQMDLLNARAKYFGDQRMQDNSERQDLLAIQKQLVDMERLQRDYEKWQLKNRDQIYNVLGKSAQTAKYFAWVYEKSGGKFKLSGNTDPDQLYEMEKNNPNLRFSEFLKQQEQQDREKKEAESKAREEAAIRQKAAPTYKEKKEGEAETEAEQKKQEQFEESDKILKEMFGK